MKITGTSSVSGVIKSVPTHGKSDTSVAAKKEDRVEETIAANDVRAALAKASDVDMSEVDRIRKEISEGTLKMDSKSLARAVLDLHKS